MSTNVGNRVRGSGKLRNSDLRAPNPITAVSGNQCLLLTPPMVFTVAGRFKHYNS